jgi:ADP-ribose pyrophosphatase
VLPIEPKGANVSAKELRAWETLSRKTTLHPSKFLTVESHTVKLPDGRVIPDWPWIIIPNAAIVLPMTDEGRFLCFRQVKYAIQGSSLAPVGGMIEAHERPLQAAKRELLEEMGCRASERVNLGTYLLDPNRGIASMHLFLARGAHKVSEPHSDDLEDQELVPLSRAELENALRAGEFKVLSWTAVVSLALNYLDANP